MAPLHFNMKITGWVPGAPCSPPPLQHPRHNWILICGVSNLPGVPGKGIPGHPPCPPCTSSLHSPGIRRSHTWESRFPWKSAALGCAGFVGRMFSVRGDLELLLPGRIPCLCLLPQLGSSRENKTKGKGLHPGFGEGRQFCLI